MPENRDELSLKELVIKLKDWRRYLLSKWFIILLVAALGGVLGLVYVYSSKPKYVADLSFVLSSENKGTGSLMGLASQFGVDVGGGGSDVFSGDNIQALMTSRRMLKKVLFKKSSVNGELLINIFCKELELDKAWGKSNNLRGDFPFPAKTDSLTPVQDSLIRALCAIIPKKYIEVTKPDKKQSIFLLTATSSNEAFSYDMARYLVEETAGFYIATKTKVAKQNLDMLQKEADSLRHLLGGTITYTAEAMDRTFNLNPAFQVQRSTATQAQTNATVIGTAYGEVVKNLEIAKITVQKETPLFQIIDESSLPLVRKKIGKLKGLIVGGFLGGVLICFFLILIRIYHQLINSNNGVKE